MQCIQCGDPNLICLDDEDEDQDLAENKQVSIFGKNYMCPECGAEMREADIKYKNYKIAKVVDVEEIQKGLKKVGVIVEEAEEQDSIQVVTNAKHI